MRFSLPRPLFTALVVAIFAIAGATSVAIAQIPRTISFQGVLADASGRFVPDGTQRVTLRIYDSPSAASAIYSETHDVIVVRGVFNAIIGSKTPIPSAIAFDRAYFLGISIGDGAELAPRTPMTSVPYALRAAVANELAPGAALVRSINGRSGDLTLQGAGATTVTQAGSIITISSSGGGGATGIQGVQNVDGTIAISNPNGPVATIAIADDAIEARHIADSSVGTSALADASVTQSKLAPGLSIPPSGPAGGDLTGTYPDPGIAVGAVSTPKIKDDGVSTAKLQNLSVTTAKLDSNAVTSAKIANATIVGSDISPTAALSIATMATSGNASFGAPLTTARLYVMGSGTTSTTTALDVHDNSGTTLLRVRDDGSVGFGIPNPAARVDIAAGIGSALQIRTGTMSVSTAAVPAAPVVAIPPAISVQITNDGVALPITIAFPAGVGGQIVYISNDDPDPVVGPFPIASGQTRQFIFVAGAWRLVN